MDWILNAAHPKLLYGDATVSWNFIAPSLLQMVLSFVLLGICASDYLCPNVARLADSNGHSTGTLMAVLLSWCNSSPDLFSNFMTWVTFNNNGTNGTSAAALSIGEVLGACGIILCVVVGSIFAIMSSVTLDLTYAQRSNVARDLAFAAVAVGLLCYVCVRNAVTLGNCASMVFVYVLYLIFKFKFKSIEGVLPADDLEMDSSNSPEQSIMDEGTLAGRIKPNLISAMDFSSLLAMLENSKNSRRTEMANFVSSQNNEELSLPTRPFTEPAKTSTTSPMEPIPAIPKTSPMTFAPYHDDPQHDSPENDLPQQLAANNRGKLRKLRGNLFRLFLPHLLDFRKKSFIDAVLSVLTAPFVIVLRLSCPQASENLEYDDSSGKYILSSTDVMLLFVQSVICPLIFIITLSCIIGHELSIVYWICALVVSAGLTTLMLQFYKALLFHNRFSLLRPTEDHQENVAEGRRLVEKLGNAITIIYGSLGIINAILWISLIANSVIEMMELYQQIMHISQSILGLTIFAWGNSVSDLISNIAMCRLYRKSPQSDSTNVSKVATKFFIISCVSCIGGVMLNSMVGIGISGIVAMLFVLEGDNNWSVELHENDSLDYKFIVSCIALLLQIGLLVLIFATPFPLHEWFKERMKPLGILMCCIWGSATLLNVLLESL
ncbi:related to protein ECM27 [Zygosaccharomyces bailii]|nr:related to protein ECM27 [Zygosaccharomyces bailii]